MELTDIFSRIITEITSLNGYYDQAIIKPKEEQKSHELYCVLLKLGYGVIYFFGEESYLIANLLNDADFESTVKKLADVYSQGQIVIKKKEDTARDMAKEKYQRLDTFFKYNSLSQYSIDCAARPALKKWGLLISRTQEEYKKAYDEARLVYKGIYEGF